MVVVRWRGPRSAHSMSLFTSVVVLCVVLVHILLRRLHCVRPHQSNWIEKCHHLLSCYLLRCQELKWFIHLRFCFHSIFFLFHANIARSFYWSLRSFRSFASEINVRIFREISLLFELHRLVAKSSLRSVISANASYSLAFGFIHGQGSILFPIHNCVVTPDGIECQVK